MSKYTRSEYFTHKGCFYAELLPDPLGENNMEAKCEALNETKLALSFGPRGWKLITFGRVWIEEGYLGRRRFLWFDTGMISSAWTLRVLKPDAAPAVQAQLDRNTPSAAMIKSKFYR